LQYNGSAHLSSKLKREDVDWSQSRIIFIAPEFTKYQKGTIGFKDLGIKLWEVHKYGDSLLVFNEVKSAPTGGHAIAVIKKDPVVRKVTEEIKVYTEDDHLKSAHDSVKEMYFELKSHILNLGKDIEVKPTKSYIAFRRKHNFVSFVFLKSNIKSYINIGINQINDPSKKAKDYAKFSGKIVEVSIKNRSEISYVLTLIKQSYEKN
jgi:predicted transport protein